MSPRGRNALAATLALLVVAGLFAAVLVGRSVLASRQRVALGDDAVAAATQLAVNFTTLDYRSFDRDARRVLDGSTGTFKAEFSAQSSQLKQLVTANKAVSKGKVLRAGLVAYDTDSARVLLGHDFSLDAELAEQIEGLAGVTSVSFDVEEVRLRAVG